MPARLDLAYFLNFFNSFNFQKCWRKVVSKAVELGVPMPCFSTALAFYDGYRLEYFLYN